MLDMLHDLFESEQIRDEDPEVIACRIETVCLDLWMNYQISGEYPNVCQDPYCPCHGRLRENVPLQLPGMNDFRAQAPDALGERE